MRRLQLVMAILSCNLFGLSVAQGDQPRITETEQQIEIITEQLEATVRKTGYVSGVASKSFLDKKTGFRDPGFGLDIVDWLMEPVTDAKAGVHLKPPLAYRAGDLYHGKRPKRSIEGPQICTAARQLTPQIIRGDDFVAVKLQYQYHIAAEGKNSGSTWTQLLVFPAGKRYFVSMDRIDTVNSSPGLFLRIDMPGHLKHDRGDTFSRIYLSYLDHTNRPLGERGIIPAAAFFENFPPDEYLNYRRDQGGDLPDRFIRAYQLRDPTTGKQGPWLAGMTLDPAVVHEAWCHQRGYICMIEEFGGRPIKAGESFSAAFIVGYFDSIDQMHRVYDQHKGHTGLKVTKAGWKLTK